MEYKVILLGCGHFGQLGNKVRIKNTDKLGIIRKIEDEDVTVRVFETGKNEIFNCSQLELVLVQRE